MYVWVNILKRSFQVIGRKWVEINWCLVYMYIFKCFYVCMCTMWFPGAYKDQKKASNASEFNLLYLCATKCGWEPDSGPLEEQHMYLINPWSISPTHCMEITVHYYINWNKPDTENYAFLLKCGIYSTNP